MREISDFMFSSTEKSGIIIWEKSGITNSFLSFRNQFASFRYDFLDSQSAYLKCTSQKILFITSVSKIYVEEK